tara:strand:- start:880 stop:2457 length:1578 start_codon:yes stop_codon:yes gene_type:complete
MARQTINTGASANDNTGDTLRSTGTKINANFSEIYTILGGDTPSSNIQLGNNAIIAEGTSANDYETTLTFINPTADRTITFPNETGTVLTSGSTLTLSAPTLSGSSSSAGKILFKEDTDNGTNAVTLIGPAATADVTLTLPASTDTLVGKATTDTLTNKTLTSAVLTTPKFADAGFIADANGNEELVFQTTASAVNHVELTNAATGNAPTLNAVGGDTNVSLSLAAKGTGSLIVNSKLSYTAETLTNTTVTASLLVPLTIHNAGTSVACALPVSTVTGQIKKFVNINAGAVTITGAKFNGGDNGQIAILARWESVELMWTGTHWQTIAQGGLALQNIVAGTTAASKAVITDANGDFLMPDGDKARLGTGGDMTLFHDGTNSFLTNATGAMKIATETSGIAVTIGHTTSETTIADNLTVTGSLTVSESTAVASDVASSAGAVTSNTSKIKHTLTLAGTLADDAEHADVTITSSKCLATSTIIANANLDVHVDVHTVVAGSFKVRITNKSGGTLADDSTIILNYTIL